RWGLEIVPLPGHAHGQIGVLTPDGVLFTADSVISERILNKYGIPFTADHCRAMETFDMLDSFKADYFIPSHGDICQDIVPVTEANRRCLNALKDEILEICSEPSTRDGIVGKLAQRHGLDMNLSQYVLIQSTVAALLSPLIDSGEILCSFDEGTLSLKSRS
ncbi:MAG: MBL fold metallo-hydrolase, partial [Synergistaceae bacterium]